MHARYGVAFAALALMSSAWGCELVNSLDYLRQGPADGGSLDGSDVDATDGVHLAGVVAIAAGGATTCAVVAGGAVLCWGDGANGQFGDAASSQSSRPREVVPSGEISVAVGTESACAIDSENGVSCWGAANSGELGTGQVTGALASPATVGSSFSAVRGQDRFYCALRSGAAACWGENGSAQCGDSALGADTSPFSVSSLAGVSALAVGKSHACAIASGNVSCWGDDSSAELGYGPDTPQSQPHSVSVFGTATALALGDQTSCALTGGNVYCWGNTTNGNTGLTGGASSQSLHRVDGLDDASVRSIASGVRDTCAIDQGGIVRCFGANDHGQLGIAASGPLATPTVVALPSAAKAVAIGESHACAVLDGGAVFCWGGNAAGQLGDGTTNDSNAAHRVLLP